MIRRVLAFAALGPISGPLAYGCLKACKNREWCLAGLYAVAIPLAWVALGEVGIWIGRMG